MFYELPALPLKVIRKIQRPLPGWLPVCPILVGVMLACFIPTAAQPRVQSSSQRNLTRLQWTKQAGVQRYRLQIAKDAQFNDVLVDTPVSGQEYVVTDLAPGRYYWRLASVDSGNSLVLQTTPFEVRADPAERRFTVARPPNNAKPVRSISPGWTIAIGEISTPIAAQLRSGAAPDIIAVNSHGTVYAIDATTGVALWTARYERNAKSNDQDAILETEFLPVIVNANSSWVIVRYEGGVRALDGSTGMEAWATELPGHFVGGLAADVDSRSGVEVYISDAKLNQLISLDASTGAVLGQTKLTEKPTGPPVLLRNKDSIELLVPLRNDAIEVRKANGEYLRTIRIGGSLTTAPVVVTTTRGVLILIGTRRGVAAFAANGFTPLGRIVLYGGDYPIGTLSVPPGDRPGLVDTLILISNWGRVAAINLNDRKVKWIVEGSVRAIAAGFADLDADGRLDILVPGVNSFAEALSASDGSLVWESAAEPRAARQAKLPPHPVRLTSLKLKGGRTVIVGNEASGSGLRALQLTGNVAGAALK